ncbi:MAG TPA: hypothetical protein VFQ53_33690 [Kofleriaceae bacterium]|nr:hypothetical protein [Kofleriaceae bacterium]
MAGVIAAGYVFLRFTVNPAPEFLLEAFGAPPPGIERDGGYRVHYAFPPDVDMRPRLEGHWSSARFTSHAVDYEARYYVHREYIEWSYTTGGLTIRSIHTDDEGRRFDDEVVLDWRTLTSIAGESWNSSVYLQATREGGDALCARVGEELALYLDTEHLGDFVVDPSMCASRRVAVHVQLAALEQGAFEVPIIPAGGQLTIHTVAPCDLSIPLEQSRWTLALVVGALSSLFVWLLLRAAAITWVAGMRSVAAKPSVRAVLVTLLAPCAVLATNRIYALGIEGIEVIRDEQTDFTFAAVGVIPVIAGFLVVEILALLLPRSVRHRPDGRAVLDKVGLVLGIGAAVVQACLLASRLTVIAEGDASHFVFTMNGAPLFACLAISYVVGTLVLVVVARVVTRHGLGNGYALVVLCGWFFESWRLSYSNTYASLQEKALAYSSLALLVVIGWLVSRLRVRDAGMLALRLPTSGVFPSAPYAGATAVLSVLATVHVTKPLMGHEIDAFVQAHPLLPYVGTIAAVFLWSWLFARRSLLTSVAERAGLRAPTRASWFQATLVSACLLFAAVMLRSVPLYWGADAWPVSLLRPFMALLAVGVVLDILADVRVNRRELAAAWSLHQPQYLGAVEHVLDEAKIPYHLHGSHVRTLLGFFGPFAPIVVFVPVAQLDDAKAKLGALFPDETNVTTATAA